MVEDHVKRYVKTKLKQGKTRAQIEEVLSVMGLSKGDINDAFVEEKEVKEDKEIEDQFKTSLERGPESRASLESKERKAFGTRTTTLAELSKNEPKPEPEDLPIFATTIEAKQEYMTTKQKPEPAAKTIEPSKPDSDGTGREILFEPQLEPAAKPIQPAQQAQQQAQARQLREELWGSKPTVEGSEEAKPVVKPIIRPEKTFNPFERPPEKPSQQVTVMPVTDRSMKLGAVIEDFREQTPQGYASAPPTEEFMPERVPRKKSLGFLPFLAFILIAIVASTVILLPNLLEQQSQPAAEPFKPVTQGKLITALCDISEGTITVYNKDSEDITPSRENLTVLVGGKKYGITYTTPIPAAGSISYSASHLGLTLTPNLNGIVYGETIPPANFTC